MTGSSIDVWTDSISDVGGPYSMTLTISLPDYPMVPALTKNFSVTIVCLVQTLTFASPPPNTTCELFVDTQPMEIPFSVTQSPACADSLTYQLSPTSNAFLSVINPTATSGSIQITGATSADINVYSIELKATATNGIEVNVTFEVNITC